MSGKLVFWTDTARSDLEEVIGYIAEDSVDKALSILDRLEAKAASLMTQSARGRIVPELASLDVGQYHELIEAPWRIIYRIESDKIFVVALLDSRRDLTSILLQRLIQV